MVQQTLILIFLAALTTAWASKILVVVPLSARSHVMLFEPLVEELGRRGHEVTYISGLKRKESPNVEHILLPPPPTPPDGKQPDFFEFRHFTPAHNVILMPMIITQVVTHVLGSEAFQGFLKDDKRQYDVVIVEAFLSEALAAGLAHKYKAPLIGYGTFMPSYWVNYMVGIEAPSSYVPDPFLTLPTKMTFKQRMLSWAFNIAANAYHQFSHLGTHDDLMRQYFGQDLPYVGDIIRNTSILFVNDHYSVSFPRPTVPNLVSIGGLHVKPAKPLPSELQSYLDSSKDGAILMSFGSNLRSADMGQERIQLFLNVFAKLKQNVLWKFETDMPEKPKNVMISDWMPQADILAHPNLKLFITHGGLLSTTESVDRGVPLVGIPIFGDQPMNMEQSVNAGVGISLDYDTLTEEKLYDAVSEVLNNPKYRQAAQARSRAMKDVIVKPMELATWWVEHVIRNKGAPQLRSAAQDLTWYQRENVDVISAVIAVVFISVYLSIRITWAILSTICGRKKTIRNDDKKKRN